MRDTHLNLKLHLFKGRLFGAFKKKSEHKAKSEDESDEESESYLTYVNNPLFSLFSECVVNFNKTRVFNALYPHKAQISNKINSTSGISKGILAGHGYSIEDIPGAFDMYSFTDRANSLGTRINFSIYGSLAIDFFYL